MPTKLFVKDLLRLTLTEKGKAIAKHPLLRSGVVEAVKAEQSSAKADEVDGPVWEEPAQKAEMDWYAAFELFVATTLGEDVPEDWLEAFEQSYSEKAQKPNYPKSRGPFAGPHNSFPIKTQQDVYDAARLIGHAQNPAAVRGRIMRIARSRGFSLPKSWQKAKKSMDDELVTALVAKLNELGYLPAKKADVESAKAEEAPEEPEAPAEAPEAPEAPAEETPAPEAPAEESAQVPSNDEAPGAEMEALKAEVEALKADLQSAKADVASAKAEVASAKAEALKAKDEAEKAASRQPLVAAPPTTEKASPEITNKTPFDDALHALLHS